MTASSPVSIDLELLEQIYDVALGRSSWREVLAGLKAEFSTEVSLLAVYQRRPELVRGLAISDPDGRRWEQYAEHFAAIDPFAAAIRSGKTPEGIVLAGDDLVPAKEFCASEYFNDWFRPNGMRHTARGYGRIQGERYLQLGMPRAPETGPYSTDEIARLQRYFNHISRALLFQEATQARTLQPDYDRIAKDFGLTPAEAKLVAGLAETGSLKRLADLSHRSYFTLRAQLRSVFLKTGTRRQADLMRLIHQARVAVRTPTLAGPSHPET